MANGTDTQSPVELRDPAQLIGFLERRKRLGQQAFRTALREAIRAQAGGLAEFSRRSGIPRGTLYKALSDSGNPSYAIITRVLAALGLDTVLSLRGTGTMGKKEPTESTAGSGGSCTGERAAEQRTTADQEPYPATDARIKPGSAKGMTFYMADDFDEPLAEFADYM